MLFKGGTQVRRVDTATLPALAGRLPLRSAAIQLAAAVEELLPDRIFERIRWIVAAFPFGSGAVVVVVNLDEILGADAVKIDGAWIGEDEHR